MQLADQGLSLFTRIDRDSPLCALRAPHAHHILHNTTVLLNDAARRGARCDVISWLSAVVRPLVLSKDEMDAQVEALLDPAATPFAEATPTGRIAEMKRWAASDLATWSYRGKVRPTYVSDFRLSSETSQLRL